MSNLLSIIVPVYNEEKELLPLLDYFFSVKFGYPIEWILVDDCSTDSSLRILKEVQTKYGFKLIEQTSNQGKGAAVSRGIQAAEGQIIIIQDADYEYDVFDIPNLIQPIIEEKADVVYGSRFKKNAPQVHRTYHYFVNRFLTILSNLCSGIYLTDMETCYKAFRSDLVKNMNLTSKRFGIEVELTAYLAKTHARIHELPISYYPRTQLQGKKITWLDGLAALKHIVYYNFFVSYNQAFSGKLPSHFNPKEKRLRQRNQ
jgi:glycosyltransferase involved in cell wall biosynthesis